MVNDMKISIVTDSTADLDDEVIARYGITVVPLNIHFGSESYIDGISINRDEFYQKLEQSEILPRTSQPSSGVFQKTYESLEPVDGIVSIHIGGKLSGTINAARNGAELRKTGSPKVLIVDSDQTTVGLGNAVVAAAEAVKEGADLETIALVAKEKAQQNRIFLMVDTLEYLQKGGRIGRARAFLGTLLRTKPVLSLINGEIEGIERPRTRQRAIDRLYELIIKTPKIKDVAILYGTTPNDANTLAARVSAGAPGTTVRIVRVSPVIGVHTGPAALGAAIEISP